MLIHIAMCFDFIEARAENDLISLGYNMIRDKDNLMHFQHLPSVINHS